MPTTIIRPASPFYKDNSAAVLPTPSALTSTNRPTILLADEKLTSDVKVKPPTKITPITTRSTPAPEFTVVAKPSVQHRGTSPYPKKLTFQRAISIASDQPATHDSSSDSLSDLSDDSDDSISSLSEDSRIPKPQGEPGRPGRGGYTLQTVLNWNHRTYSKLKKLTDHLIDEHLDTTKCASAQNPTLLKVIRDKATAAFPDLENYHNHWPVTDMIMMRLKYTSSRARRREIEMAAGRSMCKRG